MLLYPEEVVTDSDGNVRTRASKEPIEIEVSLRVQNQSGTASRRAEQDNEGFETERVLQMRLARKHHGLEIGAQSKIRWGNEWYSVFGDVIRYISSPRTEHYTYTLRRA